MTTGVRPVGDIRDGMVIAEGLAGVQLLAPPRTDQSYKLSKNPQVLPYKYLKIFKDRSELVLMSCATHRFSLTRSCRLERNLHETVQCK